MIEVLFLKSGVAYGYGYGADESGLINRADLERLTAAGVVREIAPPKRETSEAKPVKETKIVK